MQDLTYMGPKQAVLREVPYPEKKEGTIGTDILFECSGAEIADISQGTVKVVVDCKA